MIENKMIWIGSALVIVLLGLALYVKGQQICESVGCTESENDECSTGVSCSQSCKGSSSSNVKTDGVEQASSVDDKLLPSCSLTDVEQRKRGERMKIDLFNRATVVKELESGYDLVFKEPIEFGNQLMEVVNFERECCPYFTWALVFEPGNAAAHLQIYGSAQIKQELGLAFKEVGLIE